MSLHNRPWPVSGIAGVLFVVVSLAASFTNAEPPAYDSDQDVIVAWLADESDRYRTGHVIAGLTFLVFYFPFVAGLYARLREAEDAPRIWSRTALAGAIMSPAAGTTAGAFIVGVTLLEGDVSPDVATFAMAANFYAYVVSGAYAGVFALGASVVIIRTAVFPRWLGWAGAAVAFASICGIASIVEDDPEGVFAAISGLAWLGFFLWSLLVAIVLIRLDWSAGQQASGTPEA